MKVGVIGGGVGGLAAAYELAKLGHDVALYERDSFLGGLSSTFDLNGGRLERFYHHMFLSDGTLIGLLHELGLSDRIIWNDSNAGFFYQGKAYPFSTPVDLLRFTPVSFIDRVRLGLVTLYLQRVKNWRKFEGTTAASFMRKWMGRRNYEVIWGPMLKGKFGVYHDQIGMSWLWSKFATRVASRDRTLKEKLGYIQGSWGVLIDALERRIGEMGGEVHTGTSVKRILTEGGKVTGLVIEEPEGQQSERS
ncbi:MAG: FAD-dependent oxidoreductase, partial [Dehalococcoidia bacterium]